MKLVMNYSISKTIVERPVPQNVFYFCYSPNESVSHLKNEILTRFFLDREAYLFLSSWGVLPSRLEEAVDEMFNELGDDEVVHEAHKASPIDCTNLRVSLKLRTESYEWQESTSTA